MTMDRGDEDVKKEMAKEFLSVKRKSTIREIWSWLDKIVLRYNEFFTKKVPPEIEEVVSSYLKKFNSCNQSGKEMTFEKMSFLLQIIAVHRMILNKISLTDAANELLTTDKWIRSVCINLAMDSIFMDAVTIDLGECSSTCLADDGETVANINEKGKLHYETKWKHDPKSPEYLRLGDSNN